MIRFAVWTFTIVPLIAALALAMDLIPKHGFDLSWSSHARFHATWAAAKFLALGIVVAFIAQNALKNAERWAWWAMVVYVAIGVGGLVPSMLWHAGGGPPARPLIMTGVLAVIMVVALIGSAKTVFRPDPT